VPYANFWAWFWVIFFFSLGYRILARRTDWIGGWISPFLALVIGLFGVLGTNALIAYRIPLADHGSTVAFLLLTAVAVVFATRPKFYVSHVPALTFWVPAITHFYILIAGLISGYILNPPFLLLVGLVMIAIAFYLHRPTIKQLLARPRMVHI
jgi:hypothetical protein